MDSRLAKTGSGFSYRNLDYPIQLNVNGAFKGVIFDGLETVLVNANLGLPHATQPGLSIVSPRRQRRIEIQESHAELTIDSEKLCLLVGKQAQCNCPPHSGLHSGETDKAGVELSLGQNLMRAGWSKELPESGCALDWSGR